MSSELCNANAEKTQTVGLSTVPTERKQKATKRPTNAIRCSIGFKKKTTVHSLLLPKKRKNGAAATRADPRQAKRDHNQKETRGLPLHQARKRCQTRNDSNK